MTLEMENYLKLDREQSPRTMVDQARQTVNKSILTAKKYHKGRSIDSHLKICRD